MTEHLHLAVMLDGYAAASAALAHRHRHVHLWAY
jgi:hypothetical protein